MGCRDARTMRWQIENVKSVQVGSAAVFGVPGSRAIHHSDSDAHSARVKCCVIH